MRSSRELLLSALNCEVPAFPPCSFMLFKGLQTDCRDYIDFIEKQLALGLNPYVMLPPRPPTIENDHYNLHGISVSYSTKVEIKEWVEQKDGDNFEILIKEYSTPAGKLRAEIKKTPDWPWGYHVPFLDDHLSSRSRKFLVTSTEDLDSLAFLLVSPTQGEIKGVHQISKPIMEFANRNDLLICGGWGVGADMLGWIYGLENMVFASFDQPELLESMLRMIAAWNKKRMMVLLDMGIDLYIKRAWYETCHFWSPKSYRKFIYPILKDEVELAHQAGAKFGYIATSNTMPLLELYAEAGVDVLIGIDPKELDLSMTKQVLNGRVCLWGGVNGQLTVERGTEAEVRKEVQTALEILSPGGGFILSPVDNVRKNNRISRKNVEVLVDEWKRLR